ncbi:MAG: pseudouridine synthase [Actinomycetes bacterium]
MTERQPHLDGIRLQKVLADAGVASRRASEALIEAGRVSVDGQVVRTQGRRIDPQSAVVRVDGERIPVRTGQAYFAVNKPLGMVSTMSDPEFRPCLGDLVADRNERLFHVGRLDVETEGLILLTNDGDVAHRLSHPSFEVPKVYRAVVTGRVPRDLGGKLKAGVELEDGMVRVDGFRVVDQAGQQSQIELTIHAGRNRVVRRLMDEVGFPVQRLMRLQFGPIRLGRLKPGGVRHLTRHEVGELMDLVDLSV